MAPTCGPGRERRPLAGGTEVVPAHDCLVGLARGRAGDVRAGELTQGSGCCCKLGPGNAGAEAGWEREGERERAGGGPGAWAAQRSVELLTRGDW